jgi:hypothetical protein
MQSAFKGSVARPIEAAPIMNMSWPIQADTDLYIVPLDKIAPLLIDQSAVGLEGMNNPHTPYVALLSYTKSVLVERDGENKRLASMPDDGDRIGKPGPGKKKFKGTLERSIIDMLCGRSGRQIAIATVHVTKGRRLNDDQFCHRSHRIRHLLHPS